MPSAKSKIHNQHRNYAQAYLLLRVATGLSFAVHGAMRFADRAYFDHKLMDGPQAGEAWLWLVSLFTFVVPAVELLAGLLLAVGFAARLALISLGVLMAFLVCATVALQGWDTLSIQLIFLLAVYWLFRNLHEDQFSFDRFLRIR